MDEPMVEEDSKQFDSVNGAQDEDNQPDPDEPLMMDTGHGRVWLVKVHTLLHCACYHHSSLRAWS